MHLDGQPEGEKGGVKMEIGWVGIVRTCNFSVSASSAYAEIG